MNYHPNPIDISSVQLSPELVALTEKLAEHTHDRWAQTRVSQGWTYGPARNDDLKQHPGLVPYADLTEEEKDLDRVTAVGTLKAIIALGYEIVPQI